MRTLFLSFLCAVSLSVSAQKRIFIPEELRSIDFTCDSSRYSWMHSTQTRDLVFFWEKGFGDNPANPPQLEGHPMSFDLESLKDRVQYFYHFFRDTLRFSLPGSKADRYKMMVMINYSLEGTAYGGTYDNFIGALWVTPNRIQDRKFNCLAHELGHSFQLQIQADSLSPCWGGSGFFEMTSQWMLWLVNPDWLTDENYHFEAFKKLTHKAYLDGSNIYHSPYVIAYWGEKHGLTSIADLYRDGRQGEDPVMTYQRHYGISQQRFNDEMIDCYQRLVNLDYRHAYKETRRYACQFATPHGGRWQWLESQEGVYARGLRLQRHPPHGLPVGQEGGGHRRRQRPGPSPRRSALWPGGCYRRRQGRLWQARGPWWHFAEDACRAAQGRLPRGDGRSREASAPLVGREAPQPAISLYRDVQQGCTPRVIPSLSLLGKRIGWTLPVIALAVGLFGA